MIRSFSPVLVVCCVLFAGGIAYAEPFTIGVSLPLSGANAAFGVAAKNGLAMAAEDDASVLNGLTYIYEDHEYDAKKTVSTFEKLRLSDKADFIFIWGSQTCLAAAPLAERHRLPLLCFSGDPKPGSKYVFSWSSPAADYARPISAYLKKKGGYWGIAQADMPFLLQVGQDVKAQAGVPAVEETFLPDSQDFRTIVSSLKTKNLSSLVLLPLPPQIAPFVRQAADVGFSVQFLGADTFSSSVAVKASNGLMEGAMYSEMDVSKEFERRYRERFKTEDNLAFAANGYELAFFLHELFSDLPHGAPLVEILARLRNEQPHNGKVVGKYTFVNDPGHGQYYKFKIGLRRIKGLDWEPAE